MMEEQPGACGVTRTHWEAYSEKIAEPSDLRLSCVSAMWAGALVSGSLNFPSLENGNNIVCYVKLEQDQAQKILPI